MSFVSPDTTSVLRQGMGRVSAAAAEWATANAAEAMSGARAFERQPASAAATASAAAAKPATPRNGGRPEGACSGGCCASDIPASIPIAAVAAALRRVMPEIYGMDTRAARRVGRPAAPCYLALMKDPK